MSHSVQTRRLYHYIPMMLVLLIWGSMGLPVTYALKELPPMVLLAGRCLIAVLLLLPFAIKEGRVLAAPGDRLYAFAAGLSGVFLNNAFYFYSVKYTSLTNIAIIFAMSPLLTALLARIFLGEKLTRRRCLGIAVAFAGALFLLSGGKPAMLLHLSLNRGDVSEFFAALTCSIMTVLGKKIKNSSAIVVTLDGMFIALLVCIPSIFFLGQPLPSSVSYAALGGLLYLGALGSACAYVLQQASIQIIGAGATAAFLNGTPAVAIVVALFVMGESISSVQIVSSAVIFSGIFLNAGSRPEG